MKLGFIAISGVRANNRELMELGLTLPGFVERSKIIASLPSLGLLTLAGMTPAEIEVAYVEVPEPESLTTLPGNFDVVAISSFSAKIKDAYRLADRYRAAGVKVILGGLHVTALPEEARKHADSIMIGEGESSWPNLIADLLRNRLRPIYDSRGHEFDFSDAPMPRYELLDPSRYNRLTVQTQRGCPYRCEFCAASINLTPRYKIKPVDKVIAEIRRIKELWPKPFIEFADDNTFSNKRHSRELAKALRVEDIRWFTETDLSVAEDEELLLDLRASGCAQVLIGFESAAFSGLDGLEQRTNWKAKQLEKYRHAIDRIQSHGITVNGCFILGLDGTTSESFDEVWRFVRDSGLYEVQITVMTPFPGTPLYERLLQEGRILRNDAWELCTLFDVNFRPQNMTVDELEKGFRDLAQKLYSEEFTRERRERYYNQLRTLHHRANTS